MSRSVSFDPVSKIWSAKKILSPFDPQISLGEVLLKVADRYPNKIAQISADREVAYTYTDVKMRAIRTVQFYYSKGLMQGDIVGMVARNSPNLIAISLASFITGIPFNSIDPCFDKNEIVYMYKKTKPQILFCDQINYETVKSAKEELQLDAQIYIVDGEVPGVDNVTSFMENGDESWKLFSCPSLGPHKNIPAAIICSSGTTGRSKGVCISHAALILCTQIVPMDSSDVILTFSTMYWVSGILFLVFALMNGATRIITTETVNQALILRTLTKYKVTKFLSAPSQMMMLLQDPNLTVEKLSNLKTYFCGGSKVFEHLAKKMSEYIKNGSLRIVYGLTEAGTFCSLSDGERFDSAGYLLPNVEVTVIDDNGVALNSGFDGEILIRTPYPFLGYHGMPEETAAAVTADGFIRTGDLGHFDADGRLVLVGRKKENLKFMGFQYSPSEIENVLLEMPEIAEACVCGIPAADGTDMPAALVVKTNGSTTDERIILKYTAVKLTQHKQLKGGVYFVDSIPTTPSGKHLRQTAMEICNELYKKRIGR